MYEILFSCMGAAHFELIPSNNAPPGTEIRDVAEAMVGHHSVSSGVTTVGQGGQLPPRF